jgi:hypothetical protein
MVQLSGLKACSKGTATAFRLDETRAIWTEDLLQLDARFTFQCGVFALTPSAYSGEYPADVFFEITRGILEDGLAAPA